MVNATGEATKHGCRPDEAADVVAQLQRVGLDVAGLMTIGPAGPPEQARPGFRLVGPAGAGIGVATTLHGDDG